MKKLLILITVALAATAAEAQIGNVLNKVKSKSSQRANNRIDKAIDEGLDAAEGKRKPAATETTSTPENSEEPASKQERKISGSLSRFDFIAGEKVVYFEDFAQEAIGELPTNWNTNGSGEVVTLGDLPGNWLRLHHPFNYLTSNEKVLSENYTLEFDLVLQLKNTGWMYPTFSVGLISTNGQPATDNAFLKGYHKFNSVISTIFPNENQSSRISVEAVTDQKNYFNSEPKNISFLQDFYGRPVHIAIQVQKERYRLWVNEVKAFDVPKGVSTKYPMNQVLLQAGSSNYKDEQYGIYVSNIKVAEGLPDTRHKLAEEGKFSTTAILFDVNTAIMRPESGGVIKEIASVMNQYKDMRIRIIGHTDSDGADAANLSLSQKRSVAVKEALVKDYGIAEDRIETDGKGETVPIGDNKVKEGKAQNRRVEFIKL